MLSSYKCVAPNCHNKKNLHSFPAVSCRRKAWISFMKQKEPDFRVKQHSRACLCNDHFLSSSFSNYNEVQLGLARVYMLRPDAIPTVHKPDPNTSEVSSQASGGRRKVTEKASKTKQRSKCHFCFKTVYGSLRAHMRSHGVHRLSASPREQPPLLSVHPGDKFMLRQKQLIQKHITEPPYLHHVPAALKILMTVTGSHNSTIYVTDTSRSPFPMASGLVCNIFKVLLMEQHLGVIAGYLSHYMDRVVRVSNFTQDSIRSLHQCPFRKSKRCKYWPLHFTDEQLMRAIIHRITHSFSVEAEKCELVEPLWKPTLRLQKYTGLTQEHAKVVRSSVPILG